MIAKDRPKVTAGNEPRPVLPVLQHEHAVARFLVEASVAEEVEDVVVGFAEPVLQLQQRCVVSALDRDRPSVDQRSEGTFDATPLLGDIEGRKVIRAGDHGENPQRTGDGQRLDALGQVQIADDGRPRR